MNRKIYMTPFLEKVAIAASDILLTSGAPSLDERGALDAFDTDSAQYQRKIWEEFLTDSPD